MLVVDLVVRIEDNRVVVVFDVRGVVGILCVWVCILSFYDWNEDYNISIKNCGFCGLVILR